jgi:hypothetical protein
LEAITALPYVDSQYLTVVQGTLNLRLDVMVGGVGCISKADMRVCAPLERIPRSGLLLGWYRGRRLLRETWESYRGEGTWALVTYHREGYLLGPHARRSSLGISMSVQFDVNQIRERYTLATTRVGSWYSETFASVRHAHIWSVLEEFILLLHCGCAAS